MEGVDAFHTEVIAYPAITIIARSDAGTAGPSRVVGADAIDRSGLASVVSALRHDSSAGNTGRVDLPKGDAPWLLAAMPRLRPDRKSGVSGKSVAVRVDIGGRRILKKKKKRK